MNEASVAVLIGFVIGVLTTTVACVINATSDTCLREVGIERIEHCHNTQSNWYEIVWIEEGHK